MGEVRTEITLVNIEDQSVANRGFMPQDQVRRLTVNAVVDTGAWTLIINETTREKLGLRMKKASRIIVAGGGTISSQITEPVGIYWKDREASCNAVVLPREKDILLGAIPLGSMDLMVHPLKQEIIGAHGDMIIGVVK